ncbi:MAG: ABC transporter substrate-binding protein [Chloroflexi bacterium]|nr:ABC transporter substrate-binding protein [Chloroflexota bacterium]
MIIKSRASLLMVIILMVGALVGSCAPSAAPPPPATQVPAAAKAPAAQPTAKPAAPAATPAAQKSALASVGAPKSGGTLSIAAYETFGHYDIHQNSITAGNLPYQHAYNNIVVADSQTTGKIVGDLGESWDTSGQGTVLTFKLRKGVRWHDGKPFTSADAKFSLDRMHSPPKGVLVPKLGEMMSAIKQVDAPDATTLKVTLKYASASFLPALSTTWAAVFPKHVIEEKGDMKRTIMGTGPFKLKSDVPDNSFEMVKNREYFKAGRPYLDSIKYYIIKDPSTRFAAFRTKRVQMTFPGYGFLPVQLEQVKREMPQVKIGEDAGANFIGYYFLTTKAPWNDIRIRKAMSLGFDRQEALKTVENGIGVVGGPMSPGQWSLPADEIAKTPGYRQPKDEDRAEAKKLLAEARQSNLKFTLLFRAGSTYEKAAEFFKDQMAKIGVEVTLRAMEYTTMYGLLESKNYDAAQMKLAITLFDPDDVLLQYYRSRAVRNYGDFSDPEIDKLIDAQARELDTTKRKDLVGQLERRIIQTVPFVQSTWGNYVMGWWPGVNGFVKHSGQYTYWRLEDVWLTQ